MLAARRWVASAFGWQICIGFTTRCGVRVLTVRRLVASAFGLLTLIGFATRCGVRVLAARRLVDSACGWLIFIGFATRCGVRVLGNIVVNCWAEPEAMRATPIFTMSPGLESFRHGVAGKVLHALLLAFLTAAEVQKYSWHSWHIGLACALLAASAPEATILALCRWKGPQSLRTYARRNTNDIGAWVDTAAAQVINSVQAPNLPGIAGGASAAAAATAWPVAASAVPGALLHETYALLAALEHGNPNELTAAGLLALVARATEIDGEAEMHQLGVQAGKPYKPPNDDCESDDDSDDNGNDGDGRMGF
jgi:hypothetical protein